MREQLSCWYFPTAVSRSRVFVVETRGSKRAARRGVCIDWRACEQLSSLYSQSEVVAIFCAGVDDHVGLDCEGIIRARRRTRQYKLNVVQGGRLWIFKRHRWEKHHRWRQHFRSAFVIDCPNRARVLCCLAASFMFRPRISRCIGKYGVLVPISTAPHTNIRKCGTWGVRIKTRPCTMQRRR